MGAFFICLLLLLYPLHIITKKFFRCYSVNCTISDSCIISAQSENLHKGSRKDRMSLIWGKCERVPHYCVQLRLFMIYILLLSVVHCSVNQGTLFQPETLRMPSIPVRTKY